MPRRSIFTVGGTVQAGGGRYIHRKVDDELLALCRTGTFGFVLTARQMGKSSLMVHAAERLAEEGTRSVIIDLSQIGVEVTLESWYFGLLTTIEDALDLDTDAYVWWETHAHLSPAQRLTQFLQEVLLEEVAEPVVIFIDEIDTTLSLPFTDDFFAAIRYVYNARASVPAFNRLSFILIGVATPIDLINDPKRTPFNIGAQVDVGYFTKREAMPLAEGFDLPQDEAQQVLRWILRWTAGHPYLTQRLCAVLAEKHLATVAKGDVDRAVATTFFGERSEQDSNLRFVQDMLTRRTADPLTVLTTYQHIVQGSHVLDDKQSPAITHLKLSGVVGRQNGHLDVSNPIYATVFDRSWVKEQWPEHWIRRVPPVVLGLIAALFVAVVLLALFLLQTQRASEAQRQSALQEQANAQLSAQIQVSDSLNMALSNQIQVSDSLRQATEAANVQLSDQIQVSDSLRQATEAANTQLSNQIQVSDSLRQSTEAINLQLSNQVGVSDSLRTVAEERLDEAQQARLETITIALASKAVRQLKLGDAALGALLARQAFLFSQDGEGEFLDPVYDALLQTLNALDVEEAVSGGPEVITEHQAGVRAVAYSPNGRYIASGSDGGAVGLWSTGTSTMKRLDGHKSGVRSLIFSPDGTMLASGGDDDVVQVWRNLDRGQPDRERLGRHEGGVWTVAFAPDGAHLASAGADQTIRVWDVRGEGDPVTLNVEAGARIRTLTFSPKGGVLVAGGEDGVIRLWTWSEPGRPPLAWEAGQGRLHALVFNPVGDVLVAGGDSAMVQVWRVTQPGAVPERGRTLRGHEGPVNALAFSADGTALASGSSDHSVQVWNTERLEVSPILLREHTAWVWTLAFSPDGARLASGSADRTVRVWNVKPERLAAQICNAVNGRDLSPEEWSQHVGEDFPFERDYQPCAATTAEQHRPVHDIDEVSNE